METTGRTSSGNESGHIVGRTIDEASTGAHAVIDQVSDATRPMVDRVALGAHQAVDKIAGAAGQAGRYVRDNPIASIGIAIAAGFLLSRLVSLTSR